METYQFITLLFAVLGTFGFLWREFKRMEDKTDKYFETLTKRTDRLYEMWCETQKEIKDIYKDWSKER